jgi:hypothetical protein
LPGPEPEPILEGRMMPYDFYELSQDGEVFGQHRVFVLFVHE